MAWLIRVDDETAVDSDDFTLSDLIEIEKESEVPWSTSNPLREVRVAKAFIRAALRKSGRNPREVDEWTLRRIKKVFDWRSDVEGDDEQQEGGAAPLKDSSDPGSSSGGSGASTGRPKKLARSA